MTMPVTCPVDAFLESVAQGWPLTMRTWWMGVVWDREVGLSLVASMIGRCSSWGGAATMGGGGAEAGAGAMGTLLGTGGFGRT